jgi:hypothetical protein
MYNLFVDFWVVYRFLWFALCITVYVMAMVGHLKNVSPTFAQMPNRITNVEYTTVSPTIANTMLNKTFGSYIATKGLILRPI